MPSLINFEFQPKKFVHAAAYLAARCPDMTKMKLFKLLFFADQAHLSSYGRPIIGDTYIKMKNGPVPSEAYDIVKRHAAHSLANKYLSVSDIHIGVRHPADVRELSESDIEVLDSIIRIHGKRSALELSDLSHRERAWHLAATNAPMDYRLFLNDDNKEMLDIIKEEQESRELLASASF